MLCAIGLSVGFRGNVWNIGAEGQLTMGAICGGGIALAFWGDEGPWLLPLMLVAGGLGRHGLGRDPGLAEKPLQRQRDPHQPDADLCLRSRCSAIWCMARGATRTATISRKPGCSTIMALLPILIEGTRLHLGVMMALMPWSA